MAADFPQIIERLKSKARLLTERYHVVLEQRNRALEQIRTLEAENEKCRKEIERLSVEVEHLKLVATIVPDRRDVEKSRAVLSELVREIDKCITELNE